jgi:hypothetical protein
MPPSNKVAGKFYNPGYEHLTSIYRLKEAQALAPLKASLAYILPLMALQNACLAIEEYVNLTGQKVDPVWEQSNWRDTSIKARITYVYKKMGLSPSFKTGIWKDVVLLFETAGFINEDLSEMQHLHRESIPENLNQIAVDYPIYRSQAIAEEAIDLLLDQANLSAPLKRNSTLAK